MLVTRLILCALLVETASLAQGEGGQFKSNLNGYNEVPTLSTASSGQVTAQLSEDQKSLNITLTFTKLEGVAQSAHLHLGLPATTGGIVAYICGSPKPSCPATADATVTTTVAASDVLAVPAQGIAAGDLASVMNALKNGALYANVYTTKYATGEIRGQVTRGFGPGNGNGNGRGGSH